MSESVPSAAVAAPAPVSPVAAAPSAPEAPSVLVRSVPVLAPVGPRDAFPLKGVVIAVTKDSGLDAALAKELRGKGLDASVVPLEKPGELPADLGALVIVAPARPAGRGCPWTAESEAWLKNAFALTQAAGRSFAARGVRGLVASVTRLDGAFGLTGRADADPAFAGIAGLMKTAAREWPKTACRAIDLDPALPLAEAAPLLAKELAHEGPVEVALTAAGAKTVVLEERAAEGGKDPLKAGDAVIVTGGARGVTAACALALAKAFKPKLVLVGRSPLPAGADLYPAAKTEGELRAAIAAAEKGLPPKKIGERAKEILAAREIRENLARLAAAGAEVRYRACDARDAAAVKALVAETAKDFGPIRGLVHGAGVLADKAILDKTATMVDSVLDTKLAGLRHFLDAVNLKDLRLLALFSSSTARYGRVGQSDYAIANEVLNKAAATLAVRLPSCRCVSVGWGPWDGGMVDASLKALFAKEGVGAIGLAPGAEHLVAECRAGDAVESVVVAALPGTVKPAAGLPVVFERDLTLESAPVLKSHAIAGRAVVPLALSAEWLAHAALHANPGLRFLGFDDLRVAKGIVVGSAPVPVSVRAGAPLKADGALAVYAEIRGAGGVLHASATVLLTARAPKAPAAALKPKTKPYDLTRAYEVLFHGPDLRVLKSAAIGAEGFVVESAPAPEPERWTKRAPRDRWVADPAALDAAFQAMILWSADTQGAPCLPSLVKSYRQYAERFPDTGAKISAKVVRAGDGPARADIEFTDERGALLARIEGHESTVDAGLSAAFRRNAVEAAA